MLCVYHVENIGSSDFKMTIIWSLGISLRSLHHKVHFSTSSNFKLQYGVPTDACFSHCIYSWFRWNYGVSSLFRQVYIPTGLYSDRSFFRQVAIPPGRYADRSIFRQVYIPTGRYSDRSFFRQVAIPTGRYSDRALFRKGVIPTGH